MTAPGYLNIDSTRDNQSAFERDGYVILRGALSRSEVESLRAAGELAEQRWLGNTERIGEDQAYLRRVEPVIEYGDEFVDLLDHDAFFPLIREIMGSGIAMLDTSYYITPPGMGWGTTSDWHIDEALTGPDGAPIPLMLKVSIPLEDVRDLDDGPTAVIPGSHRRSYNDNPPAPADPREMPGFTPLTMSVGDLVVFHGRILHAAMPNVGDRPRRVLHYNYGHIWMKPWPGFEPSERLKSSAASDVRRQLLHVTEHYYRDRLPGDER